METLVCTVEKQRSGSAVDTDGIGKLTAKEERKLRKIFENNPERLKAMFDDFAASRPTEDASLVYKQLQRLIESVGFHRFPTYMSNPQEHDELVNSGWEGVLEILPSYDPNVAMPSTFFYYNIVHKMSKYINTFLHQTNSYYMEIRNKVKRAKDKLALEGNKNPIVMDIAMELNMRPGTIRKAMQAAASSSETFSLNDSTSNITLFVSSEDDKSNPNETMIGNPFSIISQKEEHHHLYDAVMALPRDQRDIICRLYGLGRSAQTRLEIFNDTGIPTNEIKYLEKMALNSLMMNTTLRDVHTGKSYEIKEALNFEPASITPTEIADSIMDILEKEECEIPIF